MAEGKVLDTVRELDITFVAYSPLGRGFLTGRFSKFVDIPENDWRRRNPRFQGENFNEIWSWLSPSKRWRLRKDVRRRNWPSPG